jgi:ligand-binding SRPBCC domain-containing protein
MRIITRISIQAPIERVFDLARSMDFHTYSVRNTGESIIGGRATGLIGIDESVVFKGRHFGLVQVFEAKITKMEFPSEFIDEMVSGSFTRFSHTHTFVRDHGMTIMIDELAYQCPCGFVGDLFDRLFLRSYLTQLINSRAAEIKKSTESSHWQEYLRVKA